MFNWFKGLPRRTRIRIWVTAVEALTLTGILWVAFAPHGPKPIEPQKIEYSDFIEKVKKGEIKKVVIYWHEIKGTLPDGKQFSVIFDNNFVKPADELNKYGVAFTFKEAEYPQAYTLRGLSTFFSIAFSLVAWAYLMFLDGISPSGKISLRFWISRAKRFQKKDLGKVTFADVAGVDAAKKDVQEIVDFLKNPKEFERLGGRIPKGVLLIGPSGTGKTLLARAVAGEANVPFFEKAGSDFVEMYVGVGASRVRSLFSKGKARGRCIIYIDEIDAVGRKRTSSSGGGDDEYNQTTNALLSEMDGFEKFPGVVIMASTNRPEILDPALKRPGRFDREVVVALPNAKGREEIFRVHIRKQNVPIGEDVNLTAIAQATPGFSGADIENLVNEAALCATRDKPKRASVLSRDFIFAKARRRPEIGRPLKGRDGRRGLSRSRARIACRSAPRRGPD